MGQLALTYQAKGDEDQALEFYSECIERSKGLDNVKLELDCLVHSLKIREQASIKTGNRASAPVEAEYLEALRAAKSINDNKVIDRCLVSMAVMHGEAHYEQYVNKAMQTHFKKPGQ